jgi:hypothetical protein
MTTCEVCRELIKPWGDGWRHEYGDDYDHDAAPAEPRRPVKRVMLGPVEVGQGREEGSAPWRFWHRVRLTAPLSVPADARARYVFVSEGLVDFAPAYELREV